MAKNPAPTERTQGRQVAERVSHDFAAAAAILDEGLICHAGFNANGQTFVVPMAYARDGDQLYLHGAVVSRLMSSLAGGIDVCVTVTHLDGMVLARSAFHHSMNYRSVMVFGTAQLVTDEAEKTIALDHLVDFLVPGRGQDSRPGDAKEMNATTLLKLPIREFSVKQRQGPPQDVAKDMAIQTWTGEIPLRQVAETPVNDPTMTYSGPIPEYAVDFLSKRAARQKD